MLDGVCYAVADEARKELLGVIVRDRVMADALEGDARMRAAEALTNNIETLWRLSGALLIIPK
jgi:hypothetical protein